MFHWNTQKIVQDLRQFKLVKDVVNHGQGGDVDTDNLQIVIKGSPDALWVCGFVHDQREVLTNPADSDCELIELSDGMDSCGGLNSDNDNTGQVYLQVRKYFKSQGVEVVNQLKDYF